MSFYRKEQARNARGFCSARPSPRFFLPSPSFFFAVLSLFFSFSFSLPPRAAARPVRGALSLTVRHRRGGFFSRLALSLAWPSIEPSFLPIISRNGKVPRLPGVPEVLGGYDRALGYRIGGVVHGGSGGEGDVSRRERIRSSWSGSRRGGRFSRNRGGLSKGHCCVSRFQTDFLLSRRTGPGFLDRVIPGFTGGPSVDWLRYFERISRLFVRSPWSRGGNGDRR